MQDRTEGGLLVYYLVTFEDGMAILSCSKLREQAPQAPDLEKDMTLAALFSQCNL